MKNNDFTTGGSAGPPVRFALPVFAALFLQAMYGAVDLLVVGQFANKADVSAVATGAHIMTKLTNLVAILSMGAAVLLGQQIGEGKAKQGGATIEACIVLFSSISLTFTVLTVPGTGLLAIAWPRPKTAPTSPPRCT